MYYPSFHNHFSSWISIFTKYLPHSEEVVLILSKTITLKIHGAEVFLQSQISLSYRLEAPVLYIWPNFVIIVPTDGLASKSDDLYVLL